MERRTFSLMGGRRAAYATPPAHYAAAGQSPAAMWASGISRRSFSAAAAPGVGTNVTRYAGNW